LIKVTILLLLLWAIYGQLFQHRNFPELWAQFKVQQNSTSLLYILLALILLPINLSIESFKWKILLKKFYNIPLKEAFKAIVLGNTMGLFTPNRVGEYAGRVLYVPNQKIIETVSATMVGGLSQLIVTLVLGILGLLVFISQYGNHIIQNQTTILVVAFITVTLVLLCYFNLSKLLTWFSQLNYFKNWQSKIAIVKQYSFVDLIQVLGWSFLKYVVFTTQFILLLFAFGFTTFQSVLISLVATTFLIQTIIPSISLLELGIRGNVALAVFAVCNENEITILLATTVLWMINLMLPALFGTVLLLRKKLNSNET